LIIGRHVFAGGIKVWGNDYFRGIRRHWMLIHGRAQEKNNSTTTTPLMFAHSTTTAVSTRVNSPNME